MYEATKSLDALGHLSAWQRGQSDTNRHQQVCAKHRQQTSLNRVYPITTFFTKCPGQTHPPGSPPPGSFHRGLSLLFLTSTSCTTRLTGLIMLIVWLVPSELRSNPEKTHKWAKNFHPGESDWAFPVSTHGPRTTFLSHLLATVGALTSPVSHHCFPLASIFILCFLCLFFPPAQTFSERHSSEEPLGGPATSECRGGRRDQPWQLGHFQASTGSCCLLPAPKYNPNWKQAGLTDCTSHLVCLGH